MRTGVHPGHGDRPERKKGCCSALDANDARRVADRFDIPFHALDFEAEFSKIMDYFALEYLAGRTPNPCVVCNNWLKFGQLWSHGQMLGVDYIATGHYARIEHADGEPRLLRAVDPDKDQSYVLHGLNKEVLDKTLFPLGGMKKEQVRKIAAEAGLAVASKPDSVEICFVPDGDHARMVKQRFPGKSAPGNIVDEQGAVLASHDGIEKFTIGQRKGLGFSAGERRYVLNILPGENQVVVGERQGLLAQGLLAEKVNWLAAFPQEENITCQIQIRYRHQAAKGEVRRFSDGRVEAYFAEAQPAVTPGQAAVFYQGDQVLGGGWIVKPIRRASLTQEKAALA